jgi:hypothetical protein
MWQVQGQAKIKIYRDVSRILEMAYKMQTAAQRRLAVDLPQTVDDAVKILISKLSLKDKTTIANMTEKDLATLQFTLGTYIGSEFGLWSGNRKLLYSCSVIAREENLHPDYAPIIITEELWKRLRETHKLRVVK